ncbi:MAG: glycosyltransferase family 9 protein [Candidatus Hodarchaeota archaeon]
MSKWLIKRKMGIGDVLMTTPVVSELKKLNPKTEFHYQTMFPELLIKNSDITKIISQNENLNESYDKIIDLNWKVETIGIGEGVISKNEYHNINRIDLFFKAVNMKTPSKVKLVYNVTEEEKKYAKDIWNMLENRKKIVYHINSASPIRTYPIKQTVELLNKLQRNYSIIIVGNNLYDQWRHTEFVKEFSEFVRIHSMNGRILDMTDRTTIRQAAALMSESDLVIAPDSGFIHLAAALDKRTIALFGNITPYLRIKYYEKCDILFPKGEISCIPCGDIYPPPCSNYNEVVNNDIIGALCMRKISTDSICNLVELRLNSIK